MRSWRGGLANFSSCLVTAGAAGNERNKAMKDIHIDQREEEILFEVSDEALEAAAGTNEKAGAFTLAFCSGLDTCPS
jgi:hypothetical protein